MIDDDGIPVTIGGTEYRIPPMTFFTLKRAWPHMMRLIRMAPLQQGVAHATEALEAAQRAGAEPTLLAELMAQQRAAMQTAEEDGADFVAQTDEALKTITASLALTATPPSYEDLSRALRPDEFLGVHIAFHRLLAVSGFTASGELAATSSPSPTQRSTGTDLLPSLSPTA